MNKTKSQVLYDQFAPYYQDYAAKKIKYLEAVDNLISQFLIKHANGQIDLLDVGSGDGIRAMKLAQKLKAHTLTLSDNSAEMQNKCRLLGEECIDFDVTGDIVEELIQKKFDVITTLWNVFGHIEQEGSRLKALQNMNKLLGPGSFLCLDVNNCYNLSSYGVKIVLKNMLKDMTKSRDDVVNCTLNVYGHKLASLCHFFSPWEMDRLLDKAGFVVVKRWYVDYASGETKRYCWQGQISYIATLKKRDVLRPAREEEV